MPPLAGPRVGSSEKISSLAPYEKDASIPACACVLDAVASSWCLSYRLTPGAPEPTAAAEKSRPLTATATGATCAARRRSSDKLETSGARAGATHSTRLASTNADAVTKTLPKRHFKKTPVSRKPAPVSATATPPSSEPNAGRARNTEGNARASTANEPNDALSPDGKKS